MATPPPAEIIARLPSITTWTRLEPRPREGSMERSLQAQVRDPLWFLARQWQVGEFLGDDAGSPVQATLGVEQRALTTYRPGAGDGSGSGGSGGSGGAGALPIDPRLPIEAQAEREAVALRLRGAVRLGLAFERLVRAAGLAAADAGAVIAAFRQAFPVASAAADPALADGDGVRFRALAAGRVTDGEALYAAAAAVAGGQAPPIPLPAAAAEPRVAQALADFLAFRRSVYSEPAGEASWQPQRLAYEFSLGAPPATGAAAGDTVLHAVDYPGGNLDWYAFDLAAAPPTPAGPASSASPAVTPAAAVTPALAAAPAAATTPAPAAAPDPAAAASAAAAVTTADFNFLPNHVVFRGMPDPRWWNFEDSVTDFGQLDAEHVDLAKLLVMEFALAYGNDWFSVPVPTPLGTLTRVATLVVTDTFGVRTLIRPAETTQVTAGAPQWSMYKLAGPGSRSDFIVMAPALGLADDADALEEVLFLRDDMAAMAWAIEQRLQGDLDAPVDAYEMYLRRLRADPPPAAPAATPGGPQVAYTLAIPVPDNWIPLVPVQSPRGELFLRRGTVEIPTATGFANLQARAAILEPWHPFFLADRIVPSAGVLADRRFRRARAPDGSTLLWLGRRTAPGRGPGWSGLRYDMVRDLSPATAAPPAPGKPPAAS